MTNIIIGNIITAIAVVFGTLNGTRKNKKDMLYFDLAATICFTLANFVLKGYSGVVQNAVGAVRNVCAIWKPEWKKIGWVFVVAGLVLGVYFNNKGLIGLLPVITSLWYSICVIDQKSDGRRLKIAFIINNFAFMIYAAALYNFVGIASNLFMNVTAIISYRNQYGPLLFGKKSA